MVSIVIPNWNGKRYLRDCLESLYKQTYTNFETIVVDNGSTDGSVCFLKDMFPDVKVVELDKNKGFCRAVNEGIKKSGGNYIALLNNDVVVDLNWIAELKKALENHSDIGFCASKMLFFDNRDLIDTCGDGYMVAGFGYKRSYKQRDKSQTGRAEYVFGACAGAAMYRKQLFTDVGLFDEDYFSFCEDIDLSFRAQLMGFKCLYVPTAIVYHHVRATAKQGSDFSVYLGYRNWTTTLIKNMPGPLLLIYSADILLHFFSTLLIYIYRRQLIPVLKGRIHAFINLPTTLRKRSKIQKQRKVSVAYIDSIMDRNWIKVPMELTSLARKIRG